MSSRLLWFGLILPGIAGCLFFGYFCLIDYAELRENFARFNSAVPRADLKTLFVLEARQNMHRINVFADGVWALLCLLPTAIGIHGLAMRRVLLEQGVERKRGKFLTEP